MVVALLGAALFTVAKPPPNKARALVLLPTSSLDSGGQIDRDVVTQERIASSADVLANAARKLRPVPRISQLAKNVHVSAPTPDIIQFEATAAAPARAIAIANQVADSYVAVLVEGCDRRARPVLAALKAQSTSLNEDATGLRTRIGTESDKLTGMTPGSTVYTTQTALINDLRARLSDSATQLNNVQKQINAVALQGVVASSGTRVLETATRTSDSGFLIAIRNIALGLLLGLLAGTMTALFRDRRDIRLRRRDEIAGAAGVPAVASLNTRVARNAEEWLELIVALRTERRRELGVAADAAPPGHRTRRIAGPGDDRVPRRRRRRGRGRAAARLVQRARRHADDPARRRRRAVGVGAARRSASERHAREPSSRISGSSTPCRRRRPRSSSRPSSSSRCSSAKTTGSTRSAPTATPPRCSRSRPASQPARRSPRSRWRHRPAGRPLFGVIVANPRPDDDSSGRLPRPSGSDGPRLPTRVTGIARGSR